MKLDTLQKFCSKFHWKNQYNSPFTYQGKTYATDGYTLVRIPGELKGVQEYSEFLHDSIQKNFDQPLLEPLSLEQFESEDAKETCYHCGGKGRITTCPECEGSGTIELDSGHNYYEVECQTCGGSGEYSDPDGDDVCDVCDGEGEISIRKLVMIGNSTFDNRLINKLIRYLPAETEILPAQEPMRAAVLRWPGGEGLIMPCRY
jgi:hypothetical protein